MNRTSRLFVAAPISCFIAANFVLASGARADTITVGPGKTYAKPCDAIAKANAGDVIEVDASGNYDGDTCAWSTDNLTLRGVGGRAKIDDTGVSVTQKKGIFVISAKTATIEHFELSGAAISASDGNNGAGIRHQGIDLVVRDCYFHDNQDGILGGPIDGGTPADGTGSVTIEDSEFAHNGAGDGYSHNMYIGHYASFTLTGTWSHDAVVGHLVKTRAALNVIASNRITDEDGSASYEIDVPNGGATYIIGNLIQQGTNTGNPAIIDYEEEGASPTNPKLELFVVNNSIVNDLGSGTIVQVAGGVTTPAIIANNIFVGGGNVTNQASATMTTNFTGDPKFVDQAGYDYHLATGSPCIDAGTDPGSGDGVALAPTSEFLAPDSTEGRMSVGAIDIGAYEVGGAVATGGAGSTSSGATSATGATDASTATGPMNAMSGSGSGGSGGAGSGSSSDSGCSCGVASSDANAGGAIAMLGALLAMKRRSSRRGRRA